MCANVVAAVVTPLLWALLWAGGSLLAAMIVVGLLNWYDDR